MTFTVNKSNGDIAAIINDYQKEIVAGLALTGHGYVNYGEEIVENFVRLAENFASPTAPTAPTAGQFWFDTSGPVHALRQFVSNGTWLGLLTVDHANNQVGLIKNNVALFPSTEAQAGTLVVRNGSGKIDPSSLPSGLGENAQTASRLVPGAKINGQLFNGTQDITLPKISSTSELPEGSNLYHTTARARGAISGAGAIQYDPNSGVISYNPPANAAALRSFQGRTTEAAVLVSSDVTGALGYTPANSVHTHPMDQIESLVSTLQNINATALNGLNSDYLRDRNNHTGALPASAIITRSSLDLNGYVIFAGGFCIQWGQWRGSPTREGTEYATFPLAFTGQPLSIMASPFLNVWTNVGDMFVQILGNSSSTGFGFGLQAATSSGVRLDGINWTAMGYIG